MSSNIGAWPRVVPEIIPDSIDKLEWRMQMALDGAFGGEIHYYDSRFGFQMVIYTPRRKGGGWGKEQHIYAIDGMKQTFESSKEMVERYLQLVGSAASP